MSSELKPREFAGIIETIADEVYVSPGKNQRRYYTESAYLALLEKCGALEATVKIFELLQARSNEKIDQLRKEIKELRIATPEMNAIAMIARERDKLAERVKELEGKLNTDTICPVCCEGYQGADKIGVQELKDANYKYYNENKTLKAQNKILRDAVEHTNEFCLCERFKTMGFYYNEDHKNKGRAKMGGRWLTPRDVAKSALAAVSKGEK